MSNSVFHRSAEVVKTHSEGLGASPPPRPVSETSFHGADTAAAAAAAAASSPTSSVPASTGELDGIRRELDELRRRRAALEAHRQRLLEESHASVHAGKSGSGAASAIHSPHGGTQAVWSTSGLTSTYHMSEQGSASNSPRRQQRCMDSTVLANMSAIPSEESRRRHLRPTAQLEMKSAMRDATMHDSTLLMGGFLLEDNPHTCTFGRERRFRPVVGQKGKYYLSTEVGVEQLLNRGDVIPATQQRMERHSGGTPGPGAYTPRYSKVSRPPRQY